MRNTYVLGLVLMILFLGACNDDDTPTDPPPEILDITGNWSGERVIQSIAPVTHLLAIQLWNNISSNDPPLTSSGEFSQTGNEISIRLTDSPSGYYIEYQGTLTGEDIQLTSTMVSYPPMVTRVSCTDGVDRHYDILTSTISGNFHDGVIAGNIVTTAQAIISNSGALDGEIVFDQTLDLNRVQ